MSTNEALLTNCRAIQLVDDLDPDAAHALFRQNYRAHPSLMTSVNYAAFLMDEHNLCLPMHCLTLQFALRRCKAKHLLMKSAKHPHDAEVSYHLFALLGAFYMDTPHLRRAKRYFEQAHRRNAQSAEVVAALAWLSLEQHQPDDAKRYLLMLPELLHWTDDISANIETMQCECPFPHFPYYELLVVAYAETGERGRACELLNALYTATQHDEEWQTSPSDLLLLSLYLCHSDFIPALMDDAEKLAEIVSSSQGKVDYCFGELKHAAKANPSIGVYWQRLKAETSLVGRVRNRLCPGTWNMAKLLRPRVRFSGGECHYLGCPVHHNGETSQLE